MNIFIDFLLSKAIYLSISMIFLFLQLVINYDHKNFQKTFKLAFKNSLL
jgi:hypothetical protein